MNSHLSLQLPKLPYHKTTLANGLDVITLRTGLLPIVSANLWYHVGSKNEERTQRGMAHLFEHLMFEGSEHYPGDYFKPLQRLGASVNGSTSPDRTNYYADLPAAHLELALAMESDRMANLLPALTDEKIRVQKDVVKNEYRQNYANRPYGKVGALMAEAMYPPGHPYSWLTIGAMEDVEGASRDELEAFFRRFYVPANSSLAIVGDLDPDRAVALADRYFGGIPGGTRALPVHVPEVAALRGDIAIEIREPVELDRLYLIWMSVPQFDSRDAPLAMLADVLARGRSSRLYQLLVVDRQIAQDVNAHQSSREIAGTFGVVATLRPGREIREAREDIDRVLAEIAEHGVTDDELQRVKNGRLAGFIYALDNVGGISDRLNAYNVYLRDPSRITGDFARYQSVTLEDVRRAASEMLAHGRIALSVLGRKSKTTIAPLDRTIRPSPAPSSQFRAPIPEIHTLACGLSLWLIPRRDLPIVAATVVVSAGASAHGPDRGGLASLTANVMDEGTESRSSLQIASEAENLGSSVSSSSGWDGSYVSMQCLTPYLDQTLDLALDVLLRPTFPEADYRRLLDQTLAGLRAERDSADARAYRALIQAIYPAGHPYATPAGGDETTVASLARGDLVRFHQTMYRPDRAAIVVVGDIDSDRIIGQLNGLFGDWTGTSAAHPVISAAPRLPKPRILLLDRPNAPQAAVRIGHPGPSRLDPDHDSLMIFNQILGGQFTSRLNAKLREEKGLTYGIRSNFDTRKGPGPFTISSSLQADKIAEALADIRGEVEAILTNRPPSQSELDDARMAIIDGQARHFENPSALVSRYAGLFLYGLPLDDYARLEERLGHVTIDTAIAAAHRHIVPDAFVYVVVADAASVAPSLEALGWCDVEIQR